MKIRNLEKTFLLYFSMLLISVAVGVEDDIEQILAFIAFIIIGYRYYLLLNAEEKIEESRKEILNELKKLNKKRK